MRVRLSLTCQIIGLLVITTLALTLVLYGVSVHSLQEVIEGEQTASVEHARFVIKSLVDHEMKELSGLAKGLQGNAGLSKDIFSCLVAKEGEEKGYEGMIEFMREMYPKLNVDLFQLYCCSGRTIYRAHDPDNNEDGFELWGLSDALAGDEMLVTTEYEGCWAMMAIIPVFNGEKVWGSIMVGKRLDDNFAKMVASGSNVGITLGLTKGVIASSLDDEHRGWIEKDSVIRSLVEKRSFRREYPDANRIFDYSGLQIGDQVFSLVLEIDTSNSTMLMEDNRNRIMRASFKVVIVALFFGVILILKFIKPLRKLQYRAEQTAHDICGVNLKRNGGNEIDSLVESVDEMTRELKESHQSLEQKVVERTAQLEETHKELVDASHRAGKAEVASEVLHNVGNVLNSINVATHLIKEKVCNSRISDIKKLSDMVNDHSDDLSEYFAEDPQGRHIPSYLTKVARLLSDEQAKTIETLQSLTGYVGHIRDIINSQQSYASAQAVVAEISLSELVENAIQINAAGLEKRGICVERQFANIGMVRVDKISLLQILVNLITNAKDAFDESRSCQRRLRVRIHEPVEGMIRIEVSDNGVGICEEDMAKIFRHGFTTKQKGHGFGLHSSAVAAMRMGGALTAESAGPGCGSTFTFQLPFKPVEILQ